MQLGEPIRKELLALTRLFASLAFKSQDDQEWLKRRFEMLKDILRETPAFQQILEEGREDGRETGRKEGLELERQRILQSLRQKLLDLVQVRHSELFSLAQEQLPFIQQVEVLEDLFLKIAIAPTLEDAREALLTKQ
jgi:predicted transposase YdaD